MTVNALTSSDPQIVFFLGHVGPIVNGLAKGKKCFWQQQGKYCCVVWKCVVYAGLLGGLRFRWERSGYSRLLVDNLQERRDAHRDDSGWNVV